MRLLSRLSAIIQPRPRQSERPAGRGGAHSELDSVFARDGVVYLPALFDPAFIGRINAEADRIYAQRDAQARKLLVKKGLLTRDELRSIAVAKMKLGGGRALLPQLMNETIVGLARTYLGKEPVPHDDSYVRSQPPTHADSHLPFHQDQTIVGSKLVNIWIPLAECGRDAPGLEVVVGSGGQLMQPANPESGGIVERSRLDEKTVLANYPAKAIWHPLFSVGDVIIFTGDTIHRTYVAPGMARSRASIDMRLV